MTVSYHTSAHGHRIAYRHQSGKTPGVVFLCGFRSDMESTKATALAQWCAEHDVAYTRFDYFAHGQSDGDFKDYTIGTAIADALEVLDHIAVGEQILVGSSMGGWIALHAALERKQQVRGLVGVAAAPDFSERLMFPRMTPEQRRELEEEGLIWAHSDYFNNDYPITKNFIHEARNHLLLDDMITLEKPVHLIHGQCDADVPWETALQLSAKLMSDEVTITFIKDGDHRLNRPSDLEWLMEAVSKMLKAI